jgi:hypothetical protein
MIAPGETFSYYCVLPLTNVFSTMMTIKMSLEMNAGEMDDTVDTGGPYRCGRSICALNYSARGPPGEGLGLGFRFMV